MTNSYQSYSVPETEINIWGRKSFHCRDQYHFPLLSLGICLKVPIRAWVWNRVTCPPVSCLRACGQPFKGHRPSAESSMPPLLSCSRGICQCQVALRPAAADIPGTWDLCTVTFYFGFSPPTVVLLYKEKKPNPCTHQDPLSLVPEILEPAR